LGLAFGTPVRAEDVLYGTPYLCKNLWASGTYLDTCGDAACSGRYNVVATAVPDRAGARSSHWVLESPDASAGSPVRVGDTVHLKNLFGAGSYLDTCGGGGTCSPTTRYNVVTAGTPDRGPGTGSWVVESVSGAGAGTPIGLYEPIRLKNQFGDKTYLDTCGGATCSPGGALNVVTNADAEREPGGTSSQWAFEPVDFVTYGQTYNIKNLYGAGTYLDTCGPSTGTTCTGWYDVVTNRNPDRVGQGTGDWVFESPQGGVAGGRVRIGDTVYIKNLFGPQGSYLDTCGGGGSCAATTKYNVVTAGSPTRGSGTGSWTIESASGAPTGSLIPLGEPILLKNGFGARTYLDTCGGARCAAGTELNVVTDAGPDRSGGGRSAQWAVAPRRDAAFTMAFLSDPQFYWGCADEAAAGHPISDYCAVGDNATRDLETQGRETNSYQSKSIQWLKGLWSTINFKGAVINGDLTAFGNQHQHWDVFQEYYGPAFGMTTWPGLGNHDYVNNVNDCGGPPYEWAGYNYCAADMVQNLAERVLDGTYPNTNHDIQVFKENAGQVGNQKNVTGSLAYSWDIGDFHFVQLNYSPAYTENFTRGYRSGISSWDIDITSALPWLTEDLTKAVAAHKRIVLNWHAWDASEVAPVQAQIKAALEPFKAHIKALFVGHLHDRFGHLSDIRFASGGTIPVISCGSSIYTRYIRAVFDTRSGCTIETQVINSMNGQVVPANSSNGGSGAFTISCLP
jgi:hypothetical protein